MLKSSSADSDDTPPPSATEENPSTNWTKSSSASISGQLERLQEKQRAAVERAKARGKLLQIHPDLEDLTFDDKSKLPPPLKPTTPGADDDLEQYNRGSLSDFSDYDSSANEGQRASTSSNKKYQYKSQPVDDDDEFGAGDTKRGLLDEDDPFADPFADQSDVGTPGIPEKGPPKW